MKQENKINTKSNLEVENKQEKKKRNEKKCKPDNHNWDQS